jgi:hypothetical protein
LEFSWQAWLWINGFGNGRATCCSWVNGGLGSKIWYTNWRIAGSCWSIREPSADRPDNPWFEFWQPTPVHLNFPYGFNVAPNVPM